MASREGVGDLLPLEKLTFIAALQWQKVPDTVSLHNGAGTSRRQKRVALNASAATPRPTSVALYCQKRGQYADGSRLTPIVSSVGSYAERIVSRFIQAKRSFKRPTIISISSTT